MSPCNISNRLKKSLSTHACIYDAKNPSNYKEMPLCTCPKRIKASMTIEAAVIFPLVTAFLVSILYLFRVLQVQTDIQISLSYAARKTAAFAAETDSDILLLSAAKGHLRHAISNRARVFEAVDGGEKGISILSSDVSGDYIELVAKYKISLPFEIFPGVGFSITQNQISKKWTGDCATFKDEEDPYVYVTKNGVAYHRTAKCSYLDLSIEEKNISEITDLRSANEHKYYACSECVAKNSNKEVVYITSYGTLYHESLNCNALRRVITMIHLSEATGYTRCEKCWG